MIPLQNDKRVIVLGAQALTATGVATSSPIDMLGYSHLSIEVSVASTTTGAVPASIVISHGDTTDSTAFTTLISAGTATTGWPTSLTALTSQSNSHAFASASLPWLDKDRYAKVVLTGGSSASTACVIAILSRSGVAPVGTNVGAAYVFPVT